MYKTAGKNPNGDATPPIFTANPFWPAVPVAQSSAIALAGFGKMATEWLAFVHRRLGEDLHLGMQLAASKSPVECWAHCTDFLLKAGQDYWQECAALTKLAGEGFNSGVEAGRGHTVPEHVGAEATPVPDVARAA
jgi:hypothetical protein